MDDLESLELLSLVSKVTSELQNHLGISDKTLAEFVMVLDRFGAEDAFVVTRLVVVNRTAVSVQSGGHRLAVFGPIYNGVGQR